MENWSFSKKIWAIIALLGLAYMGSGGYSVRALLGVRDTLNEITGSVIRRDQLTSEIKDNQRVIVLSAFEAIVQTEDSKLASVKKRLDDTIVKQEKDILEYEGIASEKGKVLMASYKLSYVTYIELVKKSLGFSVQNKNKEAAEILMSGEEILVKMRAVITEINSLTAEVLKEKSEQANSSASNAAIIATISALLSIIVAFTIAFFVLRSLTRTIADIVRNLGDSSTQVTSAATQIASASEQLSQATTEQAASLEETAASVEEMNSMVAKNSENARSAAATSRSSQDSVQLGKEIIQKMIHSMEAINRSSEGMAETVKVIEQIDKKTKVINEIVNKTELLSFNASVEAARAGEHGKGFAVVAEEVGNLARMSGAAAEEIASLLEESIRKVNLMVADTKKNVESGAQITRECGQVFENVVQNVNSVTGMATEISSASEEQARGCSEITKAMNQLDQMTQQNAATSEECASAAEELSAQAESLKNTVQQLILTVNGSSSNQSRSDMYANQGRETSTARQATKFVAKKAKNGKVLHLRSSNSDSKAVGEANSKRVVGGDAPTYESDGFSDV